MNQIIDFAKMRSKIIEQRVDDIMSRAPVCDASRKKAIDEYSRMKAAKRNARLVEATEAPEGLTETCVNQRLRDARRAAWRDAEAFTRFTAARRKWHDALSCAQHWKILGADEFPPIELSPGKEVTEWRKALVQQLLTPACDLASVAWKKAQLRDRQHEYVGVKSETIVRAIEADEKWLAAHASKRSKPMSEEKKTERRNFNEAMRQRIREIAALRDLSDEEIRPVLSRLKHQRVAEFVDKHGVNFKWAV